MTTIAYRDGVLAADQGIFDRGTIVGRTEKIWRSGKGLGGICGCLGDLAAFRDWFKNGAVGDPPKFKDDDSEGIVVSKCGKVEWIGPEQKRVEIDAPYVALGAGFRVAMGAMHVGAPADVAVETAADLDTCTAGPVSVLRLKETSS